MKKLVVKNKDMIIKDGYNGKKTGLRINSNPNGTIELWLRQEGVSDKEYLSYLTADELYTLYKEVKLAGKELFD